MERATRFAGKKITDIPSEVQTNENKGPSTYSCLCTNYSSSEKNSSTIGNRLIAAKWGLITPWDQEMNHFQLFNARSETAGELNSFKKLFKGKDASRGIVIFDGFYEWCGEKSKLDGKKQPFYFYRSDDEPMIAAVLFNYCQQLQSYTYTMLTRKSYGKMKPMHSRQPLLLTEENARLWLSSDSDVEALLASDTATTEVLESYSKFHPVTKKMGLVSYKEADCSTPVEGVTLRSPVKSKSITSFFSTGGSGSGVKGEREKEKEKEKDSAAVAKKKPGFESFLKRSQKKKEGEEECDDNAYKKPRLTPPDNAEIVDLT